MQAESVAMLMPEGSPGAALLVRRADGQFAFALIDPRVASAARVAAGLFRKNSGDDEDPRACALVSLDAV
jgi:hypothetical protein